eukprot:scaffold438_cov250-Pinguiococcus_pyrenoidosus.AAC.29
MELENRPIQAGTLRLEGMVLPDPLEKLPGVLKPIGWALVEEVLQKHSGPVRGHRQRTKPVSQNIQHVEVLLRADATHGRRHRMRQFDPLRFALLQGRGRLVQQPQVRCAVDHKLLRQTTQSSLEASIELVLPGLQMLRPGHGQRLKNRQVSGQVRSGTSPAHSVEAGGNAEAHHVDALPRVFNHLILSARLLQQRRSLPLTPPLLERVVGLDVKTVKAGPQILVVLLHGRLGRFVEEALRLLHRPIRPELGVREGPQSAQPVMLQMLKILFYFSRTGCAGLGVLPEER